MRISGEKTPLSTTPPGFDNTGTIDWHYGVWGCPPQPKLRNERTAVTAREMMQLPSIEMSLRSIGTILKIIFKYLNLNFIYFNFCTLFSLRY